MHSKRNLVICNLFYCVKSFGCVILSKRIERGHMAIIYGLMMALALGLVVACVWIDKLKSMWLHLIFVSVAVYCAGCFVVSVSRVSWLAFVGNSIAYLGCVFLPFFLVELIMHIIGIKQHKSLKWIMFAVGVLMLILTTSPAYSTLFYKSYEISITGSGTVLLKEYGPLHFLYAVYLLVYFVVSISLVIYSFRKKSSQETKKSIIFVLCVLIGNVAIWGIEKIIDTNFEFLTVSFLLSESLLLFLYSITSERAKTKFLPEVQEELDIQNDLKYGFNDTQIQYIFFEWAPVNTLTKKEKEILKLILKNDKRKVIADKLYVSENTIKKHTASIFRKLKTKSRDELFSECKKILNEGTQG